jgi:hypothetical protein
METSYRIYVTDSLRDIPQMTYMSIRWADAVGLTGREVNNRTAEELVDDFLERFRGNEWTEE